MNNKDDFNFQVSLYTFFLFQSYDRIKFSLGKQFPSNLDSLNSLSLEKERVME